MRVMKNERSLISATASLAKAATVTDETFGFAIPTECPNVPSELLISRQTWQDGAQYDKTAQHLAALFHRNFASFADGCTDAILDAAPKLVS